MCLRSSPRLSAYLGVVAIACATLHVGAQDITPTVTDKQGTYTLHISNQAVVLDVVVNDQNGEPKENLTQNDFTVYEGKVPQKILSFERSSPPLSKTNHQPPAIHSTADLDRLEPSAPVTIIALDELTTTFEDGAFALYSLRKYLHTQGDTLEQPTMLLAANYEDLVVLRDYTTSRKEILDALDHHFAGYNFRAKSKSWMNEQLNGAFSALTAVAQASTGHAGHKNLLWIGRGMPPIRRDLIPADQAASLKEVVVSCTNLLRDARITLYSIDPAGLPLNPANADDDGMESDPFGGQVDFDSMATATGGTGFHGRNDVDHLIGTSVRDGETFYTLSYKPSDVTQDPKAFRKIRVAMRDPNLVAMTREGYFATPAAAPPAEDASHPSPQMVYDISLAAQGLMVYDAIPLTVNRDIERRSNFRITFPASTLAWKSAGENQTSQFTYLVESFDRQGKLLQHAAQELSVHLPTLSGTTPDTRQISFDLSIATQAPVARLRFVVRSNGNGKIGAGNYFLIVPEKLSDPATGRKPARQK